MTMKEAKEVLIIKAGYGDFVENIIDQIFDDHEAQLKAKDKRIAELEQLKNKSCEGCKWEQETNLITTKVGDKVDICTLCTRYENLQDNYEKNVTP